MSSWLALEEEIQRWNVLNKTPSLWWRDDDAQQHTPALDRLNVLSRHYEVPLHLAVIPKGADSSLLPHFHDNPYLHALQHGYTHQNHACADKRKCELGDDRNIALILDELSQGRQQLDVLLGDKFSAVLVPPWNRLRQELPAELLAIGITGISTLGPRGHRVNAGLIQTNVHVDLIDWKKRTFAGQACVLGQLVEHLQAKRLGEVDDQEATGIMTHHLVHDEQCWKFMDRLLRFCQQQPVSWLACKALFDQ